MYAKFLHCISTNKWLLIFNLLGLYLFAKMAEDVIEKEHILVIDRWISSHINAVQTPLLNQLMVTLTNLNGGWGIVFFSVALVSYAYYKRWYHDIVFYVVSVGGAAIAFIVIKLMVQRVRPSSDILVVSGYSFPSGHATMSMAMMLALYFTLAHKNHSVGLRMVLLLLCLLWAVLIAFSRVYLDVHWVSDVIAGLGLGLFWVTFIVLCKKCLCFLK